jgi:hypothetical protein
MPSTSVCNQIRFAPKRFQLVTAIVLIANAACRGLPTPSPTLAPLAQGQVLIDFCDLKVRGGGITPGFYEWTYGQKRETLPIFVKEIQHAGFAANIYFKDAPSDIQSVCTNLTAPNLRFFCPLSEKKNCLDGEVCVQTNGCASVPKQRFDNIRQGSKRTWDSEVVQDFRSTGCEQIPGYAYNATCYYWFEIGVSDVAEGGPDGLALVAIDWNYETAFMNKTHAFTNTTNSSDVSPANYTAMYNNTFCSDDTRSPDDLARLTVTGSPCKLALNPAKAFDDFEQLFAHLGLNFSFMLLLVVLVFACCRGEYGYAYQEMFVRHPFSPPAQGTKLLDLSCATDPDASPVDRTIEKLLRPGAKIQKGTWRDTWFLCNELEDDDGDDDDDDALFASQQPAAADPQQFGRSASSKRMMFASGQRSSSYKERGSMFKSSVMPDARKKLEFAPPLPFGERVRLGARSASRHSPLHSLHSYSQVFLYLNTRFDSVAFREGK